MKPMIDGVICAFHTPDGISVEETSKLLNINKEVFSSAEKPVWESAAILVRIENLLNGILKMRDWIM